MSAKGLFHAAEKKVVVKKGDASHGIESVKKITPKNKQIETKPTCPR